MIRVSWFDRLATLARTGLTPARNQHDRAYLSLLAVLALFFVATGLGGAWDRHWHEQNVFEDFWSPPHLFIYIVHSLACVALFMLVTSHEANRMMVGAAVVRVKGLAVAAPFALLGAAFAAILFGGVMDLLWHSFLGLDETPWSFPHAFLGLATFVTFVGFTSCVLGLAKNRQLRGQHLVLIFLCVVLLATALTVVTGPYQHHSRETIVTSYTLPVIAEDPRVQHLMRIYLANDMHRSNPAFVPLAALAIGSALGFARTLGARMPILATIAPVASPRAGTVAAVTAVLTGAFPLSYFGLGENAQNFAPIPFLIPGVLAGISPRIVPISLTWIASGLAFGAAAGAIWGTTPLSIAAAGPIMLLGARTGRLIGDVARNPTGGRISILLVMCCGVVPALMGFADLVFRVATP